MGCGDSKLAVATSNAILRKKSNAGDASKKIKDTGTAPKAITDRDNSVAISKGQHQDVKEAAKVVNKDNVGVLEADDDVKNINENKKEDAGDKDITDNKEYEAGGRLRMSVDSQREFFSSRKLDDIGIDAIISDGRSGASDYYTPRHGPGNKGNLSFKIEDQESKVVTEEDKKLLLADEETKPAVVETTSPSKENTEEPVVQVEEKMLDETAEKEIKVTSVEAKVSSPAASSSADEEDKKETEVEKEGKEEKKELEKEEKKELEKEKEVEEDKKAEKL